MKLIIEFPFHNANTSIRSVRVILIPFSIILKNIEERFRTAQIKRRIGTCSNSYYYQTVL